MEAAIIVLSIIVLGFLFRTFYNLGYAQAQQDARCAPRIAEDLRSVDVGSADFGDLR